jgi:hypothetical protein
MRKISKEKVEIILNTIKNIMEPEIEFKLNEDNNFINRVIDLSCSFDGILSFTKMYAVELKILHKLN